MVVLCIVALEIIACPALVSGRQISLASSGVKAVVDTTGGRLLSITDTALGESYRIKSDVCVIEISDAKIDLAKSGLKLVSSSSSSCVFTGECSGLKITRSYSFPRGRSYLDRKLAVKNVSGRPMVIKTVTDCALGFAKAFDSAAFHDDNMDFCDPGGEAYTETEKPSLYQTSINVFLRNAKGGLYAGLKYPYFKPDFAADRVSLSYEINYRIKPGETLELPTMFVGVYAKTGYVCRKELDWTPRILSTRQEELDLGEVRAMQIVMRDYLPKEPCPRDGYFTWLNSWWGNAELRGRWGEAEAAAFCKLADNVRQSKSLDMISTAPVWCGWTGFIEPCDEIDAVGDDATYPRNAAIDRAMAYVKSVDLPVSGFCEPNSLNRHYRKDRPDWKLQPTQDPAKRLIQNCHANDAYEDWFYRLTCSNIDAYGLAGWAWDHNWLRRPMICWDATHGHEPGNCEFQQYRNITNLIARLRKRYPKMFIEIYWGLKEAGPWSLRGLNSLENAYENGSPPPPGMTVADDIRFQHWFNHNYRFIPTYMDMAQMNFAKEGNGHLYSLLSCLNASTHASLCDWTKFSTDKEADEIFGPMRKWKAWAARNMAYLEDRIDLFGMPCRKHGIDGTAHVIGDRGFIFAFNPSSDVCHGSVPLGKMIGLTKGARYRVAEISTDTARRIGVYKKDAEFVFEIQPKSALLFELTPSKEAASPAPISSGARIQPAFVKG